MVRNFGEKRKKKSHKKPRGKGSKGDRDMEEAESREVAIYVPPEQREADEGKSKTYDSRKSKNCTYRSKRMERQRLKKDRKKEGWGYIVDPEDEEEDDDDDDVDYGGEYDEIIRTGPSRREAREAREFEQMASTSVSFIDLGTGHGRNGRTRTGRNGHNGRNGRNGRSAGYGGYGGYGGHGGIMVEDFSMLDVIMMAIGSSLSRL